MISNDLEERQRDVAKLVDNWPELFRQHGVAVTDCGGEQLTADCPECGVKLSVTIELLSGRGYPTWHCGCNGHLRAYDSYLGLIVAVRGISHTGDRGRLLGQIEDWALRNQLEDELPEWKFSFGKYRGKLVSEVPANYAVWAAKNVPMIPRTVSAKILAAFGAENS